MGKSILGVWIGLFWITTLVWGETPVSIMSSDEVERGMKGVGRTVFEGTKIEEFEVEVLGVLKNWDPQSDLILARLSGKPGGAIDRAGLIAGMSGSPIYIDGRLIGAVAYGWTFAKEAICGITPIENMHGVAAAAADAKAAKPTLAGGTLDGPIVLGQRHRCAPARPPWRPPASELARRNPGRLVRRPSAVGRTRGTQRAH